MSKLILSASLLLICKISSAHLPNDRNKNIIAPYVVCDKEPTCKDSFTSTERLNAEAFVCHHPVFTVISFTING